MRIYRDRVPMASGLASLLLSACSLTGPLDGYATGEAPPDAGVQDASNEETSTTECAKGYTDCDGNPANGCEVNLQTDKDHCGSCTGKCNEDFADVACQGGKCVIVSCTGDHADCDTLAATGCEADTTSSVAHCGACSQPCQVAHGTPVCDDSVCAIASCAEGWGDCNSTVADGCETNVKADSLLHCGACNTPCEAVANSNPDCNLGVCEFACKAGYADCDLQAGNGCETDIFKTLSHCGSCDVSCSSVNGTPTCAGGNCSITCNSGFDNCNNDVTDGCETNLRTDPEHCGTCATACTPPDGASATCVQSVCGFACTAGRGNCDADDQNGCETDLLGDTAHCGVCGHDCGGAACSNGYCEPTPLSSQLTSPYALALDSTHVYWTDTVDGTVMRQVKDGSLPAELIASPGSAGLAIAVDSNRVYYSTSSSLRSHNKVTDAEVELAPDQVNVRAIAVDSTGVYWVTGGTTGTDGTVMRGDLEGAKLKQLATGQPQPAGLALFGTAVYWTNQGTWTGADYNHDGSIWKNSGGSTNVEFIAPLERPSGIGVDGSAIVWANRQSGTLYKKDTSGGAPVFVLAGQTFGEDLVIKDGIAYWTFPGSAPSTGAVMRVPLAAGTVKAVAPQQNYPRRVAVDSTHVYWTVAGASEGEGAVLRVVK